MNKPDFAYVEPVDALGAAIARDIYENSAERWTHMEFKPLYFPPAHGNQPGSPRHFSAGDARTLYNATSFMMWDKGIAFNSHMTVVWRGLSVQSHLRAAKILSDFNKEAAAWLRVGEQFPNRQRQTKRCKAGATDHFYIYAHENGTAQGIHTHQLMVIPPAKGADFQKWAVRCLTRLAGRRHPQPYAVVFTPSTARGVFAPSRHIADTTAAGTTWHWYRYLTKSIPDSEEFRRLEGTSVSVRAVIKTRPSDGALPVYARKVVGASENISRKSQRLAGFQSKLERGEWNYLYDGSELEMFRQNEAARARMILPREI